MLISLKVPIAVKDSTVSGAIVVVEGPTVIEWMVAAVTFSAAVPVTEPTVAVMVVAGKPPATPSARPVAAPIVATDELDELHVACIVMSRLLPSS